MTTAVLLVFLGALSRLIPHPPNFVALGALALYAGARLPRQWAWAVPLAAMALSDFVLDLGTGRRAFSLVRLTIYATFAGIVFAGRLLRRRSGALALAGFSVGASTLFFATSNLAEWASQSAVPEDGRRPRALLRARRPLLLEHARRGSARHGASSSASTHCPGGGAPWRPPQRCSLSCPVSLAALRAGAPAGFREHRRDGDGDPEEEKQLGVATTVITREEIEKSGRVTVLELLRSVPALDVVQSGSDGSLRRRSSCAGPTRRRPSCSSTARA